MVGATEDALSRFFPLLLEQIEYEDDYGRYFGPTELVISSGTPGAYRYPVTGVRSLDHYLLAHHKATLPLSGPRPSRSNPLGTRGRGKKPHSSGSRKLGTK